MEDDRTEWIVNNFNLKLMVLFMPMGVAGWLAGAVVYYMYYSHIINIKKSKIIVQIFYLKIAVSYSDYTSDYYTWIIHHHEMLLFTAPSRSWIKFWSVFLFIPHENFFFFILIFDLSFAMNGKGPIHCLISQVGWWLPTRVMYPQKLMFWNRKYNLNL